MRATAREALARLGLDADAIEAGRADAAALAPAIAGSEGAALADALGELATEAVAALLVALEPHATGRDARTAIRRALYRLAQRGVAVPARPAAPAPRPAAGPEIEGLLSHADGRGDRLVWLTRPSAAAGVLLVAAQLNEPGGLIDLQLAEVSRKQLRAARQRLEAEARLRLVAAPWRVLDALLVEAHERAGSTDRQRDYLRVRPRLTSEPAAPAAEPVSPRVTPPTADEAPALVRDSLSLLDQPELATWWPAEEALAPFVEEIAGVRESPILVSRVQQEERVREVLRRAAATVTPPAVLARRLAGIAYVLAETGRAPAARTALAVAALLRERPGDAADIPFVAALVERPLGQVLAAETARREEAEQGSLVMTPAQFLKDRSASRPGRTRG